jgi:hypothetical protein
MYQSKHLIKEAIKSIHELDEENEEEKQAVENMRLGDN